MTIRDSDGRVLTWEEFGEQFLDALASMPEDDDDGEETDEKETE